jgi:hypothetical protein
MLLHEIILCYVENTHVADGGDGLQIRKVASDILKKQSRTADNGWSSSLWVGRGTNNSPPLHRASDLRALVNTVTILRVP